MLDPTGQRRDGRREGARMAYDDLVALPGIGPRTAPWLLEIGVSSCDDIERLGSVAVYRRLRASRPGVSLNVLWVIECLVLGCDWRDLPPERKAALREELSAE